MAVRAKPNQAPPPRSFYVESYPNSFKKEILHPFTIVAGKCIGFVKRLIDLTKGDATIENRNTMFLWLAS